MKQGYLSQYFAGVATKVLSAVETNINISNQHEFNGVAPLTKIFGIKKRTFKAKFLYLMDSDTTVVDEGFLTWYDARENHPTRTEYRMYFSTNKVLACAKAGDELFIGLKSDSTILVVIAESASTVNNQIKWLFGIADSQLTAFAIREKLESEHDRITFASRFILEQLGIEIQESEDSYLEDMLKRFDGKFPSTKEFSKYARSTLTTIHITDNPDIVIMNWMEREEILFRTLEKHIISQRLEKGFNEDVDGFIQFSLSVLNRRKSRAGQALENHAEQLFIGNNVKYARTANTENNSKPDFIFPGIAEYCDLKFDTSLLTMLGVKSTCKDRWRQVLAEADRIKHKHLLTLESAISENQTKEMRYNKLQLVVPEKLHNTYTAKQRKWLLNMSSFIELIKLRQKP